MEGLAEGFIAILVALIIIKTPREKVNKLLGCDKGEEE